jgi:Uma2 family endonuclease
MDGNRPGLLERAPWVRRHKPDVSAYYRMAETGILTREDCVELIEGEIVDTVPTGSPHGGAVNALLNRFVGAAQDKAIVTAQSPLRLSDTNEPRPDAMVLRRRPDFHRAAHPTAGNLLLLVEVAQTGLPYDRKVKLPLYARHGVPEGWIMNIGEGVVDVDRNPKDETYRTTACAGRGETLEPAALPGLRIAVTEVLG